MKWQKMKVQIFEKKFCIHALKLSFYKKNYTKLRRVLYSFPAHITNITSSFPFISGSDSIFVNPFVD